MNVQCQGRTKKLTIISATLNNKLLSFVFMLSDGLYCKTGNNPFELNDMFTTA